MKFIFATTDPQKVLPTVVSRCQRYDLRRIALDELVAHLEQTAKAEKKTITPAALALLAREADGSLRVAQSLLEQVFVTGATKIDEGILREVIGGADRQLVVSVADAVLDGDAAATMRALRSLHDHGYDARRFCRDLLEHFRHLAIVRATGDRTILAGLPEAEVEVLTAQAQKRSSDDLQRAFRLLLDADEAIAVPARTIDPQLVLEMAVLRIATLTPLVPLDELAQRLEALARGGGGAPAGASGGGASTRTTTPARTTPTAAPAGAGSVRGDGSVWDGLLARVQAERVSLFMALSAGRPLGLENNVLRIGLENEALRRDCTRKESLDVLRAIASELAGRAIQIEIGPLPAGVAHENAAAQAKRREEETLSDPLVQAAVEIFGAEVRGVRDRRA